MNINRLIFSLDNKQIARILIESGADVTATNTDGITALHLVARSGREDLAKLLINKGANVNAKANDGMTPLLNAVYYGNILIDQAILVMANRSAVFIGFRVGVSKWGFLMQLLN